MYIFGQREYNSYVMISITPSLWTSKMAENIKDAHNHTKKAKGGKKESPP
jgi:hypothetical protein